MINCSNLKRGRSLGLSNYPFLKMQAVLFDWVAWYWCPHGISIAVHHQRFLVHVLQLEGFWHLSGYCWLLSNCCYHRCWSRWSYCGDTFSSEGWFWLSLVLLWWLWNCHDGVSIIQLNLLLLRPKTNKIQNEKFWNKAKRIKEKIQNPFHLNEFNCEDFNKEKIAIQTRALNTYKYLVMSSMSINIESCLILKSSRSIKYFTSTSLSVSMNVWNSLMIICSWAMFMLVNSCRDRRRFVAGILIPTLSSVWWTSSVMGHIPCFWRSIFSCWKKFLINQELWQKLTSFHKLFTSICMCAMSFACAKAIRASIWRRACCVKKLLSLGGPSANVAGRSAKRR